MTDLIKRLEEATAGSRELDALVFQRFGSELPNAFGPIRVDLEWQDDGSALMPVGEMQVRFTPPPTTQSLDAALALAERLGLSVSQILNEALEGPSGEGIWATGWNPDKPHAPQIAKFVCIAILKATDTGRE
jgi:hypothetical protein